MKNKSILILILIFTVSIILYGCTKDSTHKTNPITSIETVYDSTNFVKEDDSDIAGAAESFLNELFRYNELYSFKQGENEAIKYFIMCRMVKSNSDGVYADSHNSSAYNIHEEEFLDCLNNFFALDIDFSSKSDNGIYEYNTGNKSVYVRGCTSVKVTDVYKDGDRYYIQGVNEQFDSIVSETNERLESVGTWQGDRLMLNFEAILTCDKVDGQYVFKMYEYNVSRWNCS